MLQRLAEHGLLQGERIGIDASTMEANAALRTIVRRDTGESYRAMLERLAAESGIATPRAEDLIRLDRQRKGKRLSNGIGPRRAIPRPGSPAEGRPDPSCLQARARGRSRHRRWIVAAEIHPADQGDTATLPATLETAKVNLAAVDVALTPRI